MAQAMWDEIQKTESEAGQLIVEAKQHGTELLKKAREQAVDIIKNAESQATNAGEALLSEVSSKNEKVKEEHLMQLDHDIRRLELIGEQKIAEAVQIIIEKVVS